MRLTQNFYELMTKTSQLLLLAIMTTLMVACGGDDDSDGDDVVPSCDDFSASAVRTAANEIQLTITEGSAPYAYTVTYQGGATQDGETSQSPVTIALTETAEAQSITVTDETDCSATAELAACALTATAVASDGEITLTVAEATAPYTYVITYAGGSTQEGQFTDESTTITADQSEDATLVLTDADFCTTETTVSADDLTSLLDTRDGQRYQIVTIGTQTWLAENFNYDYSGSLCYDDDAANCEVNGKFYSWEMVTQEDFAPEGWKVPSKDDLDALLTEVGDNSIDKLEIGGESGLDLPYSGINELTIFGGAGDIMNLMSTDANGEEIYILEVIRTNPVALISDGYGKTAADVMGSVRLLKK
ncbi:hypothetical protein BFP72_06160 [Reichenbachiella sp. 5M10]|uniref:FISUMP domain-containing protein n=1 Tax=Reichenbachiella sp. 5M10 TaxID=1889772 RepID=UPI000C50C624|nr:FISUMP domain-containing protein [Reichenbachiella sp. 5M10]PIB35005.1 hypothetical protein BFP72_06160 [Reichenbachiella sp. 5M10]